VSLLTNGAQQSCFLAHIIKEEILLSLLMLIGLLTYNEYQEKNDVKSLTQYLIVCILAFLTKPTGIALFFVGIGNAIRKKDYHQLINILLAALLAVLIHFSYIFRLNPKDGGSVLEYLATLPVGFKSIYNLLITARLTEEVYMPAIYLSLLIAALLSKGCRIIKEGLVLYIITLVALIDCKNTYGWYLIPTFPLIAMLIVSSIHKKNSLWILILGYLADGTMGLNTFIFRGIVLILTILFFVDLPLKKLQIMTAAITGTVAILIATSLGTT